MCVCVCVCVCVCPSTEQLHVTLCRDYSLTCAREEEIPKLVERDGHDPVSEVECLLYPVTMVNIYVDVEHPGMIPKVRGEGCEELRKEKKRERCLESHTLEQLQDRYDDIIHIAEPRGLQKRWRRVTREGRMLPCFCLTSNFFAWWSPPAQLMAMSQFCWGGRQWCCYGNLHVNSCPLDSPHWSASRLPPERLQCRWSRSHRDQGRQDWVCAGRGE